MALVANLPLVLGFLMRGFIHEGGDDVDHLGLHGRENSLLSRGPVKFPGPLTPFLGPP